MPLPNYFSPKRKGISIRETVGGLKPEEILQEIERGARFVVFQYVLSFILITQRRNSRAFMIRPGEPTALHSLPYTVITALLGWWGFPYGIVYTLQTIPSNIKGGIDITDKVVSSLRLTISPRQ